MSQTNEPLTMNALEETAARFWSESSILGTILLAELDATRAKVAALETHNKRLDDECNHLLAKVHGLGLELARVRPVVEAAKAWRHYETSGDANTEWIKFCDSVDALSAAEAGPKEERT